MARKMTRPLSETQIFQDVDDGEITYSAAGELLEELGWTPYGIRIHMSKLARYSIPKGYFGKEEE